MGLVLEGEEFGAEVAEGDVEGGLWGWARGESFGEEGVVVCYVDVGDVVFVVVV